MLAGTPRIVGQNSSIAPGSAAIGALVVGGDPYDLLFVDGSGNLGQNDLFTYQIGTQFNVQLDTGAINIDDTTGTTTIKSYGLRQLSVSDSTGIQQFGDLDGDWSFDLLKIDGPNRLITIQDDNEPYLSLDVTNQVYQMGDIGGVSNNSVITVNDAGQSINLTAKSFNMSGLGGRGKGYVAVDNSGKLSWSSGTSGSSQTLAQVLADGNLMGGIGIEVSSPGDPLFYSAMGSMMYTDAVYNPIIDIRDISSAVQTVWMYDSSGQIIVTDTFSNPYFAIGTVTGDSYLGSSSGGNKSNIAIDDSGQIISMSSGGYEYFYINASAGNYAFGDANGQNSGAYLIIEEAISGMQFYSNYIASNSLYFNIDNSRNIYQLGDILSSNHGTYISVDDLNELITLTNIPTYANDAAATGAGLTTGQLYKTTTLGTTSLNIVP